MNNQEEWNPDRACQEMAELFAQADAIISQPHYQQDVSADSLQASSADPQPSTTDVKQS